MTQQKLKDFRELLKQGKCTQKDFIPVMRTICKPIVQHPDYENDIAYDIDDVIEMMELLVKEDK
jgi:hypothetical protein